MSTAGRESAAPGGERFDDVGVSGREAHDAEPPILRIDHFDRAPDHHAARVRVDVGDLPIEARRHRAIVGVHAGQPGAPRRDDAGVQRRGQAVVRQRQHHDPRVVGGGFARDGEAAIRRAVVDDDQLEGPERLRGDAVDGRAQECLAIPHGEQHRHQGMRVHGSVYLLCATVSRSLGGRR
jgi:hypothetical protein